MRSVALVFLLAVIIIGCAATIKEFYPDSYFKEDNVYQNKPLRFSLDFQGNWDIETDPNRMDRGIRKEVRRHQKIGVELLFAGTTTDGLQGVSAVAANLNESTQKYAEIIRELNKEYLTADSGLVDMLINGKPIVKWEYSKFDMQYVEFFFTMDTYNVRVAFWAEAPIFKRFLPVYLTIMSSLDFISRY
ncbi:unnamed protein product [marine sediment metagenome]|uniref:Uncharacterized protein n=1 Tax=marine sediment metagenome TaxID=412755 RepID=X1P8B8_9ZZZZ